VINAPEHTYRDPPEKNRPIAFRRSKSFKVIESDTDRSGTCDWL